MANPDDQIDQYQGELRLILWQTLAFAARAVQLSIVVGVHLGIHHFVLPMVIPPSWQPYLLPLFEVVFFAAFAVTYTQQVFDMATIFVPWLRQKREPLLAEERPSVEPES